MAAPAAFSDALDLRRCHGANEVGALGSGTAGRRHVDLEVGHDILQLIRRIVIATVSAEGVALDVGVAGGTRRDDVPLCKWAGVVDGWCRSRYRQPAYRQRSPSSLHPVRCHRSKLFSPTSVL